MPMTDAAMEGLTQGLEHMRAHVRPGDITRIASALETLRGLPFPPAYLDGIRDEMFNMLTGRVEPTGRWATRVYLAFYGIDGRASYLKIGIAKDVHRRLAQHATGNPMPNLWTYTASFLKRSDAGAVEAALLRHLTDNKARGEWVHVQGLSEGATAAVVEALAEVACALRGSPVVFERLEV